MSQHDYTLDNQSGASFRSDLNTALGAIVTRNSGTTQPATMFPRMEWIDTTSGAKKRRNAANSAWIVEGTDAETRVVTRSSNTMIGVGDFGCTFLLNGTFTQTFEASSTLGNGWWCRLRNDGSGIVTLDPSGVEQINGFTTFAILPGASFVLACNGSGFKTIGYTTSLSDNDPVVQNSSDPSKKLRLSIAGFSSGVTRALTIPDANFTVVGENLFHTLTNKTIDADLNFISNIDQGNIKTAQGEISTTASSANIVLPGGSWGFWPEFRVDNGIVTVTPSMGSTTSTSFVIFVTLSNSSPGDTVRGRQRYIQASPPYDLGDGPVAGFVYALVDSLGKIVATYVCEDPPYANNGPTDIHVDFRDAQGRGFQKRVKPDLAALRDPTKRDAEIARLKKPEVIEVTQAMKQADMQIIPHPFIGNTAGHTVVLLDPMSRLVEDLCSVVKTGGGVAGILHGDLLTIGNTSLKRAAPPGVLPVSVKWK